MTHFSHPHFTSLPCPFAFFFCLCLLCDRSFCSLYRSRRLTPSPLCWALCPFQTMGLLRVPNTWRWPQLKLALTLGLSALPPLLWLLLSRVLVWAGFALSGAAIALVAAALYALVAVVVVFNLYFRPFSVTVLYARYGRALCSSLVSVELC
jgi:hypothetical protein